MENQMLLALSIGLFAVLALAVVFVPLGIALRSHWIAQREWISRTSYEEAPDQVDDTFELVDAA